MRVTITDYMSRRAIVHKFSKSDEIDHRLGYTTCGVRFAWGETAHYLIEMAKQIKKEECKVCYG